MPQRQPAALSKRRKRPQYNCFIWPQDQQPKAKSSNSRNMPRWLDVLVGKGPDIFVGNISSPNSYPDKKTWSQWSHFTDCKPATSASFLPWPLSPKRSPTQLYNFRARKYKEWTSEWNPLDYPCAYCCCVPWARCKHSEPRYLPQRTMRHCYDCYDRKMLETDESHFDCEGLCPWHLPDYDHYHAPLDISRYRCDGPDNL